MNFLGPPSERENEGSVNKSGLYQVFRYYPRIRRNLIFMTFCWVTNSIVYNGLSFYSADLKVNPYVGFFIASAVEFPSYAFYWWAIDRLGRRKVIFGTMVTGGVAGIVCLFVPSTSPGWIIVALAMFGKFQIAGSFAVIYIYAGELMPTIVRNKALAWAAFMAGVGLLFFPYINYLGNFMYALPLFVMGILSVLGGSTVLVLPETLNRKMPDTLDDGERLGLETEVVVVGSTSDAVYTSRPTIKVEQNSDNEAEEKVMLATMAVNA